ncbi:hypothetical protein GCM10020220_034930 [Nonomuraea rubra]|uniref:hypothetical protein n=1 Tax=Nonomuraea rubra TaxID=46180 RepID=UPI0031E4ED6A
MTEPIQQERQGREDHAAPAVHVAEARDNNGVDTAPTSRLSVSVQLTALNDGVQLPLQHTGQQRTTAVFLQSGDGGGEGQ